MEERDEGLRVGRPPNLTTHTHTNTARRAVRRPLLHLQIRRVHDPGGGARGCVRVSRFSHYTHVVHIHTSHPTHRHILSLSHTRIVSFEPNHIKNLLPLPTTTTTPPGRDGQRSTCLLMYRASDAVRQASLCVTERMGASFFRCSLDDWFGHVYAFFVRSPTQPQPPTPQHPHPHTHPQASRNSAPWSNTRNSSPSAAACPSRARWANASPPGPAGMGCAMSAAAPCGGPAWR